MLHRFLQNRRPYNNERKSRSIQHQEKKLETKPLEMDLLGEIAIGNKNKTGEEPTPPKCTPTPQKSKGKHKTPNLKWFS